VARQVILIRIARRLGLVLLESILMLGAISGCGSIADENEEVSGTSLVDRLYGSEEENLQLVVETHLKREDFIVSCMKAEGFEYEPPKLPDIAPSGEMSAIGLTEAMLSGFGFADNFLVNVGLDTDPDESIGFLESVLVDEAAKEAYGATLYGDNGCQIRASQEYPGVFDFAPSTRQFMNSTMDRARASSEYLVALSEWQDCMANSGFPDLEPMQLFEAIRGAFQDFEDSVLGWGDEAIYDHERFAELQTYERKAATAEAICTPALLDTQERLYIEYLLGDSESEA
jgi:hypothetical protein